MPGLRGPAGFARPPPPRQDTGARPGRVSVTPRSHLAPALPALRRPLPASAASDTAYRAHALAGPLGAAGTRGVARRRDAYTVGRLIPSCWAIVVTGIPSACRGWMASEVVTQAACPLLLLGPPATAARRGSPAPPPIHRGDGLRAGQLAGAPGGGRAAAWSAGRGPWRKASPASRRLVTRGNRSTTCTACGAPRRRRSTSRALRSRQTTPQYASAGRITKSAEEPECRGGVCTA